MRIDNIQTLIEEYPLNTSPTLVLSERAQKVAVIQLEPDDSFETLQAILEQQTKLLIIVLPERAVPGAAFSSSSHFALIRERSVGQVRCLVIPSLRITTVGKMAQQHGIAVTTSIEQALIQAIDAPFATPFTARGMPGQKPRTTGTLSPQFQLSSPITPFLGINEVSNRREQEPAPSLNNFGTGAASELFSLSAPTPSFSKALPVAPAPPAPTRRIKKRRLIGAICVALLVVVFMALIPWLLSTPGTVQPSAAGPAPASVGQIVFGSSGQLDPSSSEGINDQISLNLHNISQTPAGASLYAWLLPDTSNDEQIPLLLGTLNPDTHGSVQISYQSPAHQDLLANYSRILVTEESSAPRPMTPSLDPNTWKYQGAIPNVPTPGDENHFSLLDHMRHLLASDPDLAKIGLSGGLTIWLYRNSQKVAEWSSAARDDWTNANVSAIRPMITRVIDYLDGSTDAWRDLPPNTPFLVDAKAGRVGLLEVDQTETPPAYLAHINIHMIGLTQAPGATSADKQMGIKIGNALKPITTWYQNARSDAIQLAKMTDQQLTSPQALTLLNDLVVEATDAFAGQITSTQTIPGIAWIYAQLETLATIPVMIVSHS